MHPASTVFIFHGGECPCRELHPPLSCPRPPLSRASLSWRVPPLAAWRVWQAAWRAPQALCAPLSAVSPMPTSRHSLVSVCAFPASQPGHSWWCTAQHLQQCSFHQPPAFMLKHRPDTWPCTDLHSCGQQAWLVACSPCPAGFTALPTPAPAPAAGRGRVRSRPSAAARPASCPAWTRRRAGEAGRGWRLLPKLLCLPRGGSGKLGRQARGL